MYIPDEYDNIKQSRKKARYKKPFKKKYAYSIPYLRLIRIESNKTIDEMVNYYKVNLNQITIL